MYINRLTLEHKLYIYSYNKNKAVQILLFQNTNELVNSMYKTKFKKCKQLYKIIIEIILLIIMPTHTQIAFL